MSTDFLDLSGVHSLGKQLLDARFPVLEGLSPIALKILNAATSELLVARGVDILRIGDTPSGLYFVDAGEVEIFRLVGGRLEKVDTLRAGDVFGEFGVLRGFARTALVRTASPCRLLRVEAEAVHQVLEGNAEFRARLESLMHSRMRQNFFAMHPVFAAANARL
ncbi:MAG: cyclic nucleotide-binding domain-containing protein, partial [Zetaproteobacteria bacterium]